MAARYRDGQEAIAKADGTAVFNFAPALPGHVIQGSIIIAGAPAGSGHNAVVGAPGGIGDAWGGWPEDQPSSGVQALSGQTISVLSVGLVPGLTYTATLIGADYDLRSDEVSYLSPSQPYSPTVTITTPSTVVVAITRDTATAATAQLLPANSARAGFAVQIDNGASDMSLLYGSGVPSAANRTVLLEGVSADYFEDPLMVVGGWKGAVQRIWDGTTGGANVTEWST